MFKALGLRSASAGLFAIVLLAGCGRKDADPDVSEETASTEEAPASNEAPPATSPQPAENPVTAPLTSADVGRWEKGMEGEMQAVRDAGAKLKSARTSADTLTAMMGVQEMSTNEAGAKAAGVDPERYKFIRSNLSAIVAYLTPSLGGIDTTMLSQAQRDELRQGNEAQILRMQQEVPADLVEEIKPRAVELRKKNLELVAARLKGAGMQ